MDTHAASFASSIMVEPSSHEFLEDEEIITISRPEKVKANQTAEFVQVIVGKLDSSNLVVN